jgi:hypothetical protein
MSEINTVINVSNTDIITMLVVKNRANLEAKLTDLRAQLKALNDDYAKYTKGLIKGQENNPKILKYKEAAENFIKVITKIPFRSEIISNSVPCFHQLACEKSSSGKIEGLCINFYAINPDKEDAFYEVVPEGVGELYVDIKIPVKVSLANATLYKNVFAEIYEIEDLLRNETKMKEQLIARVTEKAIEGSTVLKEKLGLENLLLLEK